MDFTITNLLGRKLDARLELSGSDVIVHSRSGQNRNPEYRPAVEAMLERLDAAKIGYEIYLDSLPVQHLPLNQRRLDVPKLGNLTDRFNMLVCTMNASSSSNGAYRRIRVVTDAQPTELKRALDVAGAIGAPMSDPHQKSGEAQDRRQNETPGSLTLVSDIGITFGGFEQWHSALMNTSVDEGDYFEMPFENVRFRQLRASVRNELRLDFWLGESSSAAVQINEPSAPGTENPLGGLAVDAAGNLFIVRQGVLHENNTSARITAPEFLAASGLTPLVMFVGGRPATRQWHLVTPLAELTDEAIAENTARFVAICWAIRTAKHKPGVKVERLPAAQLRKVQSAHIDAAVATLLSGEDALNFANSTDYDVLAPGNVRLAPKKVFGLALKHALGIEAFPGHFASGYGNLCFQLIEAAGYPIVSKTDPTPNGADLIDPDLAAAEGNQKLVRHLKRERKPALAAAKRRAMVDDLGHLACERCGVVPSELLGPHGDAVIEVHHAKVQMADMAQGHVTRLTDLQCLCANCHRIVHREMANSM